MAAAALLPPCIALAVCACAALSAPLYYADDPAPADAAEWKLLRATIDTSLSERESSGMESSGERGEDEDGSGADERDDVVDELLPMPPRTAVTRPVACTGQLCQATSPLPLSAPPTECPPAAATTDDNDEDEYESGEERDSDNGDDDEGDDD